MLMRIAEGQQAWLDLLEEGFATNGVQAERATRAYWYTKHNVNLGLDPAASSKVFVWGAKDDGSWEPRVVGRGFDSLAPPQPLPVGMSDEMAKVLVRSDSPREE
jgi:hypothetical protein